MGQASLQNALDVASGALADVPTYGLREVLILFAGLSTCDPGEISHSIAATKVLLWSSDQQHCFPRCTSCLSTLTLTAPVWCLPVCCGWQAKKCRVSVLGLAAEVFICKEICDKTGGTYTVALHAEHLHEQMMGHAPPPPSLAASSVARLVIAPPPPPPPLLLVVPP